MNAEIISVGTELLLGEILNTDAQFLARELSEIGIGVYHQTVVGDNYNRLKAAVETALSRCDIVIASGGLGPTPDDITKEVLAECMGEKLVLDQESLESIRTFFKKIGREMVKMNEKQAYMPEHCIILKNHHGTAPGCIIEKNGKVVIMLPGPPSELKPMYIESVKPYLQKKSDVLLYSKVLQIFGIGESAVAEKLKDMMENMKNPTLAPYAKDVGVRLRITAMCKDKEEGEAMIAPIEEEIRTLLGDAVYGIGEQTLAEVVVDAIKSKGLVISAAESCTGGMFAQMITDIAGASSILNESIVTYSNEAKIKYLGVKESTLKKFGAVSEQTAREMAEGICRQSGADIGVGITGIAGPDGGSEEKPVGLVYAGICMGGKTIVKKLMLSGNRAKIRYGACLNAFDMIRHEMLKNSY
ncbi:MAG: competence/damage-inducible protein A [Clostridia bacterium]|nr:competence/damage-inducible protein A [Clostridia bacterium]